MTPGTPPPLPPPDSTPFPHGQSLACGADIDDLLEQIADGRAEQRSSHQQQCPHCEAALRELSGIWAPVQHLADQSVEVPAGIITAVMRHIHELTRDVWHTLHLTDSGAIRVAARVVASLAARAASRVSGVGAAFGRSSTPTDAIAAGAPVEQRPPHAAAGVLGDTAIVDLALTITYGQPIAETAHRVQQQVITELRDTIGLQRIAVNITVDDVDPAPETHDAIN